MNSKKIVAAVDDLMFAVKINEAAKRAGMSVDFVKSEEAAMQHAANLPTLLIVDLNGSSIDSISLITRVKTDESLRKISVLGFVSHVQGELKQQAQDAGCDLVLARSAFSQNLPQILKRHTTVLYP
ncbi:MAG: response regulator [Acidobacteria bacterium]|nr:response regulator [Acidobacteriota bacterium]